MTMLPEGFEYTEEETVIKQPADLPEGFEYSEDTSPKLDDDQKSMLPDFIQELSANLEERVRLVEESAEDYKAGKIDLLEYTTQVGGKGVAGSYLDLAGALVSGGLEGISFLVPDSIEKPALNTLKEGIDFLTNTESGQEAIKALSGEVEDYNKWKEANPQDAKTLESVINIGLVFTPVKTKRDSSPVPSFERPSQKIIRKGATQRKATSMKDVQNMLYPEITPEMAKRTTEKGFLRIATYKPTSRDFSLFNEVRKVPGLKPRRSGFFNLDKIQKEAISESNKLGKVLAESKIIFPRSETKRRLQAEIDNLLKENTFIAGDKQLSNTIKLNYQKAVEILDNHPSTPSGLLNARRAFDKALKDKMPTVFSAQAQTVFTESSKVFRNTMNKIIDEKVPSAYVKKSLAKQSSLYRARDMLAPIASKESRHGLGRLYQNLNRALGLKTDLNRSFAALGGISAVAAANVLALGFGAGVALGGGVYGTVRLLGSPTTKKALGEILKYTDKAIQTSTNPKMIKQLRLDRAFIQDLFELSTESLAAETNKQGE